MSTFVKKWHHIFLGFRKPSPKHPDRKNHQDKRGQNSVKTGHFGVFRGHLIKDPGHFKAAFRTNAAINKKCSLS